MSFRLLSPAHGELAEAAAFYDERVPGLGVDFLDEVDAAIANPRTRKLGLRIFFITF
mgnify:CR=1 FL=1